jgi:hypothetical protein
MARTTIKSCNTAFLNSAVRVGLNIALVLGGCIDAASQGTAVGMPAVEAVTYDGAKVTPHEFTGDLRHMPLALPAQAPAERPYRPLLRPPVPPKLFPAAAATEKAAAINGPLAPMPSPAQNFAGMSRTGALSVTFPSVKRLSPLTRHYGTGRSTPFGRTCRAFQCALDLVLEPLATQRPAAVNRISNLAKFARIQLATEKLPVSLLPFLCCAAEPLVLLVSRK